MSDLPLPITSPVARPRDAMEDAYESREYYEDVQIVIDPKKAPAGVTLVTLRDGMKILICLEDLPENVQTIIKEDVTE